MEYFGVELKKYIKHFWWEILLVIAAWVIIYVNVGSNKLTYYESPNTERVYGDKRVFDYAGKLTSSEEKKLEKIIHMAEETVCQDIVIVTLDESLKNFAPEYMSKYSMRITPDKYVMVYADKFWEDNKFGYDGPQVLDGTSRTGDGVLLVDNLHREEETGKIYTWMCTTGKAEREYSSSMIDNALDAFYDEVENDYYRACVNFVEQVVEDLGPKRVQFFFMPFLICVLFAFIYYLCNKKSKKAENTVGARTYLVPGSNHLNVNRDTFIRKSVTKVYNPPSSSGGGGGHHSSGGGGSHGGGGRSR